MNTAKVTQSKFVLCGSFNRKFVEIDLFLSVVTRTEQFWIYILLCYIHYATLCYVMLHYITPRYVTIGYVPFS